MSTQTLGPAPLTLALVSELPPQAPSRLNPDLLITDLAPQLQEPLLVPGIRSHFSPAQTLSMVPHGPQLRTLGL